MIYTTPYIAFSLNFGEANKRSLSAGNCVIFGKNFAKFGGDIPLAALKPSFVQQFFQLGDRASYHLQRRRQTLHSLTKIEGFAGDAKRAQSIRFIYIIPFFRIVYSHFMYFNS